MHMEKSSFYFPYVIYAGVCVVGVFFVIVSVFFTSFLPMLMGVVIK